MSYGMGCRHSSDHMLLWLWCRPEATAPVWPLAWEPLYATDVALKRKKKKSVMYVYVNLFLDSLFSIDLCDYCFITLSYLVWLPLLHLVILLGYYLVPLSGTYFPAISCCLTSMLVVRVCINFIICFSDSTSHSLRRVIDTHMYTVWLKAELELNRTLMNPSACITSLL